MKIAGKAHVSYTVEALIFFGPCVICFKPFTIATYLVTYFVFLPSGYLLFAGLVVPISNRSSSPR